MMGDMKSLVFGTVLLFGCAGTSATEVVYTTPGVCHFDYGTRIQVRHSSVDGSALVATNCETTQQVLAGRM